MSWSEGRRLSSLTTGGNTTTYTYDLNGLRNKKVNADGTWVEYFIADGKTIGETLHRANNTEVYDMRYTFDENGDVCGISIWRSNVTGWEKYYFLNSLQGDVLAIYKSGDTFTKVGEYTYDSWGNVLSVTGVPSNDDAATLNPFRYRSYYQDPETNFYYLQSRYYDPQIGRFINADVFVGIGQRFFGCNMYIYCGNNTINFYDPDGFDAIWIQEKHSAMGQGHSGLMVQDDNGDWWYFYWGPSDEGNLVLSMLIGTTNGSFFVKIPTEGYNLHNTKDVKQALLSSGTCASQRSRKTTQTYYFSGDFSNTYYAAKTQSTSEQKYNLFTNNCVQVTTSAFLASDSRFANAKNNLGFVIPNCAASNVNQLTKSAPNIPYYLLPSVYFSTHLKH